VTRETQQGTALKILATKLATNTVLTYSTSCHSITKDITYKVTHAPPTHSLSIHLLLIWFQNAFFELLQNAQANKCFGAGTGYSKAHTTNLSKQGTADDEYPAHTNAKAKS
jgi:hypothetical protein